MTPPPLSIPPAASQRGAFPLRQHERRQLGDARYGGPGGDALGLPSPPQAALERMGGSGRGPRSLGGRVVAAEGSVCLTSRFSLSPQSTR